MWDTELRKIRKEKMYYIQIYFVVFFVLNSTYVIFGEEIQLEHLQGTRRSTYEGFNPKNNNKLTYYTGENKKYT